MKSRFNHLLIFLGFIIATGCAATTKPNPAYTGLFPASFDKLAINNPLLAQELGKLPEIQDGVSEKDVLALERICVLYHENQKNFDSAFQQMYGLGYPNVRKFCSPLQALYWLAMDDKLKQIDISNYTLAGLLNEAWYKSGFEYDGTGRWDDFGDVTERLNSPKLVEYYERRNFSYKQVRLRSPNDHKNPRYIFRNKQGACWLYTAFSVYCLKKAGYKAYAITVYHGNSPTPNHVACEFIDKDGREYILDNSLTAYSRGPGLYEKPAYLNIYPYYGKGYLSE
jgi:hypothetical protein